MSADRSPGKPLSDRLRAQLRALQPAKGDPDLGPLLGTIARLASSNDASLDQRGGPRPDAPRTTSRAPAPEVRTLPRANENEDRLHDSGEAEAAVRRLRAALFAEPAAGARAHAAVSLPDTLALLAAPSRDEPVCSAAYRTLELVQTPAERLARRVVTGALAVLQPASTDLTGGRLARSLALVSVLRAGLDEAAAPEVGRDLARLYDFCLDRIWTALVDREPQPLAEARSVLEALQLALS